MRLKVKSEKIPLSSNDIIGFKNDRYELIHNLKYRKVTKNFQKHLVNDITSLKSSQNIIVPVDRTTNLYNIEIDNYKKLPRKTSQQPTKKQKIQQLQKLIKKLKQ